jgi:hypothetical protein
VISGKRPHATRRNLLIIQKYSAIMTCLIEFTQQSFFVCYSVWLCVQIRDLAFHTRLTDFGQGMTTTNYHSAICLCTHNKSKHNLGELETYYGFLLFTIITLPLDPVEIPQISLSLWCYVTLFEITLVISRTNQTHSREHQVAK